MQSLTSGPVDPDSAIGHLHFHVADLDASEYFFLQLGMKVTQNDYPGARFLAVGEYHHHVGINLWARGKTASAGSIGLFEYLIAGETIEHSCHNKFGMTILVAPN